MLGGRISNHDEEEVEDELEALAAEMNPVKEAPVHIPAVPQGPLKSPARVPSEREAEPEPERREAMLA